MAWARNEANLKIRPKADELRNKLFKLDKPLLEKMGTRIIKDGIPSIGKTFFEKGFKAAGKQTIAELLGLLCSSLMASIEERRIPEANYGIKLSKELRKSSNK